MTIGRILGKLEADLRTMRAERNAWRAACEESQKLRWEAQEAGCQALAAMTAERDAALKQLALTEDRALADLAELRSLKARLAAEAAEAAADDFGYFW